MDRQVVTQILDKNYKRHLQLKSVAVEWKAIQGKDNQDEAQERDNQDKVIIKDKAITKGKATIKDIKDSKTTNKDKDTIKDTKDNKITSKAIKEPDHNKADLTRLKDQLMEVFQVSQSTVQLPKCQPQAQ